MTNPSIKAGALEKLPAAKPSPSRWIPEDDPKLRVNVSYKIVVTCFSISGIASLEM